VIPETEEEKLARRAARALRKLEKKESKGANFSRLIFHPEKERREERRAEREKRREARRSRPSSRASSKPSSRATSPTRESPPVGSVGRSNFRNSMPVIELESGHNKRPSPTSVEKILISDIETSLGVKEQVFCFYGYQESFYNRSKKSG
jgi:hypothetical protein